MGIENNTIDNKEEENTYQQKNVKKTIKELLDKNVIEFDEDKKIYIFL